MGRHKTEKEEETECEPSPSSSVDYSPIENDLLEPFIHQVGGHVALLSWNSDTVCKPLTFREKQFYESIPSVLEGFIAQYRGVLEVIFEEDKAGYLSLVAHSSLSQQSQVYAHTENVQTTPKCHSTKHRFRMKRSGSLELETCTKEEVGEELFQDMSTNTYTYSQNPWAIKCQTRHVAKMHKGSYHKGKHCFVLLKNLVGDFRWPCVLDVKMGIQQHGDDAPEQKRRTQTAKCERSTSAKLGVRLVGMQVYDIELSLYRCVNKYHGRELSEEGLKEQISSFVQQNQCSSHMQLCLAFIKRLELLLEILLQRDGYRFFSSSLLLMYDGGESDQPVADVRMIDFEHSTFPGFLKDRPHSGPDQGYILGLQSLISIFNEIVQTAQKAR